MADAAAEYAKKENMSDIVGSEFSAENYRGHCPFLSLAPVKTGVRTWRDLLSRRHGDLGRSVRA